LFGMKSRYKTVASHNYIEEQLNKSATIHGNQRKYNKCRK
jgi:hypothetical protein